MIDTAHAASAAVNLLDAHSLISSFGTIGIAAILFAETGLLFGLFLPGDSLLFTAGVFSATRATATIHLSLGWVLIAAAVGALLGAQTGYGIGRITGPRIFDRPDRPRLTDATARTRAFLDRYGTGKALVLARFVPLVRTAINPLAGAVGVPAGSFITWQVVGGLAWSLGVTLAGWQLGSHIHNIDHYLLPLIAVIIVGSLVPVLLELRRSHARGRPEPGVARSGPVTTQSGGIRPTHGVGPADDLEPADEPPELSSCPRCTP
jgi:membrane-associated protein